jgi:hypothetical protein
VCACALLLDEIEEPDAVAWHRPEHVQQLVEVFATPLEDLAELADANIVKLTPVPESRRSAQSRCEREILRTMGLGVCWKAACGVRVRHLLLQTSVCESRLQITPWLGGVGRLSRTARHDVHHPALGVEGRHDGDFPAADVGTVGCGDGVLGAAAGSVTAIFQRA